MGQGKAPPRVGVVEQAHSADGALSAPRLIRIVKGAILLEQGRTVEALASLTKVIEVMPTAWEAYLSAASASGSLGRLPEAAALLAEAEELAPGRDIPEGLKKWRSQTSPEPPRK